MEARFVQSKSAPSTLQLGCQADQKAFELVSNKCPEYVLLGKVSPCGRHFHLITVDVSPMPEMFSTDKARGPAGSAL